MFTLPLYVTTCFAPFIFSLLTLCHLVRLSSFVCIFASLFACSCVRLCVLVCVIKLNSYLQSHAGSHLSLYTRSQVPFKNFAWFCMCRLYSNLMELRTPKSKPTFVLLGHLFLFVCLITSLFAPLYAFFPCLPFCVLSLFLCYLFYVSTGFVFSLLLHVHAWSEDTTSNMQAKKGKNVSKQSKSKKGNDQ